MKKLSTWFAASASLFLGCQRGAQESTPVALEVAHAPDAPTVRSADDAHERVARQSLDIPEVAATGAAFDEGAWVGKLRKVCADLDETRDPADRATEGSDTWKDKISVDIRDFRIYSPVFKTWNLAKVDDATTAGAVRHSGPYYGMGLTVEVENKSDQVLDGDDVYVWATFTSKDGERVCFGSADQQRSWDPFAKKGVGAWSKEKDYSEWPFRPGEKKRFTVSRNGCFSAVYAEAQPESIKVDVYARFRPLSGKLVITGPLATVERKGDLLRGAPVSAASAQMQLSTKKELVPVQAQYVAGDQALVVDAKGPKWVPIAFLAGNSPTTPIAADDLPAATDKFEQTWGSLTLQIENWRVDGWKSQKGALKTGHKIVAADVRITVDSSSVQATLAAAVTEAAAQAAAAAAEVQVKMAEATAADAALAAVAGTDAETGAKDAAAAAKAGVKTATDTQKAADKASAAAQKALTGGVATFLKDQAKAVDCGSFKIDVGRGVVKPMKGSFGAAECKALLAGEPVKGSLSFDLERWDMPFLLTWNGGGTVHPYRIASHALGDIPKE